MTNLSDLIERVEAAKGPDQEIDAAIYYDLLGFCRHANKERTGAQSDTGFDCMDCGADSWGNKSRKGGYPAGQGLHDRAPRYTASLDAALTLAPEGAAWAVTNVKGGIPADADFSASSAALSVNGFEFRADAATPALALVAASLRALQEKDHPHA